MANSAPMIGEKGRDFAVDLVKSTKFCKICLIGDSLLGSGKAATFGHILRLAGGSAQDGMESPSDGLPGIGYFTFSTLSDPSAISAATKSPGDTGGYDSPQTYCPHQAREITFNANAVDDLSGSATSNRILSTSVTNIAANKASVNTPAFEQEFYHEDWISSHMDEGNGGDITYRVYIYANPEGVGTGDGVGGKNRIFLECYNGVSSVVSGSSSPFSCYSATAELQAHTLTIPAAKYADMPFGLSVRVLGDGDAGASTGDMDGGNCIICGSEVTRGRTTGLSWLILAIGGTSTAVWVDGDKFSADSWDRLVLAGVTHVIISLDANGISGDDDQSQHKANLAALMGNILDKLPNCKFCLLSPYEISAGVDARIDASYEVARERGCLYLNTSKLLPPIGVLDAGITTDWQADTYYYIGNVVRNNSTWYSCNTDHTSEATWAADAASWTEVTGASATVMLQISASHRNWMLGGSGVHQNTNRGSAIYAQAIWSLLREAAARSRIQLGEHGVFRKL